MTVAEIGTRFTGDLRPLRRAFREAADMGNRYGQEVRAMSGHMEFFAAVVRRATALVGVAGLGAALQFAATEARGFGRAMAEVQTVAGDASQMGALTESVRALGLEFGKAPTDQAKALYEIMSAGTSDAAAATDVLTQANRLALGGVTDVKTAADGLTSTLNAYGAAAGGAAAVSDSFFVAAAAGKTTIEELSSKIGKVAPIAAALKIPLDEVTAAIAALTKGGISTGPAVAGLAQVMSSVIKPSKEAADTAAALGLQFNAAALQSKGLAGFLKDVEAKTKGDATAMGLLFGGVEALVPALALSTTAAGSFADALAAMENKAGATQRAVDIMAATMDFRINKLQAQASAAMVRLGTSILNAVVPAAELIASSLVPIMDAAAAATIVLASAIGTRLVVAFIRSTASKAADFLATQAALRANVQYTAAVAAQAQAQFVAATAALNAARAETALTGSVVAQRAALVAVGTAHAQAAAATAAHTAAMNAASVSARLAAGSMNLLRGAMAFFGGPIGLAITAVLTVVGLAFYNTGRKAREAAAQAKQAADEFRAALAGMDEATVGAVGRTQRYNYGILQRASAQQQANIDRQKAIVDALRAAEPQAIGAAAGRGIVQVSPELARAERSLREQQGALAAINNQWEGVATKVRIVREQEAAMARQRAAMPVIPETPTPPDLTGAADADKQARSYAEALRERATLLTEVFEAERTQGRATMSVMGELNRLYEDAAVRLRAMGDATRLSPESLQDYRALLEVVERLRAEGMAGVGPEQVRTLPAARMAPTASTAPNFQEAFIRDRSINFLLIMRNAVESGEKVRKAMEEGAKAAAERLKEASENVRGMWSGLLSGLPSQLGNLASMFSALREKRAAQVGAGQEATGLLPLPGAIAFMLAAEALAPVLDALREPMAALMVPVQMAAQAFGPLLTSLLKAFFPIFKQFGISITYVAQVAGYVAGALFKVVGEIIRTLGSLIAKIPGLGEEGAAIKNFGKGLTDASKEMFEMAKAMPGVREELKNLDWDEAMKRAADGANALADSLTNVPEVFNLIARQTQAMRGPQTAQPAPPPLRQQVMVETPSVLAVSASVANAASVAGTIAARSITNESARWRDALVQGAEMAASTLSGAAGSVREALAGLVHSVRVTGEVRQATASPAVDHNTPRLVAQVATLAAIMAAQGARKAGHRTTNFAPPPAPSPSSPRGGDTYVQGAAPVHLTIAPGAFVINGGDPREVEAKLRKFKDDLIRDLKMPGATPLRSAVREAVSSTNL